MFSTIVSKLKFHQLCLKSCCCILVACSSFDQVGAQSYQVYFGDLHEHSIFSWDSQAGAKSPAAAYSHAKHVAQIDFMAITDHTNGLSESNYQGVRAAAQLYDHPDSQFVAIAGQELGSLGSTGYGHMNIFEPPTRADNASDNDTRYNLSHAYQFLIDNGLMGQFNHPTTENGNSNFNDLAYFPGADLNMNGLEVLNGKRSSNYEAYYLQALANGWHVGALGDQDNHAGFYGNNRSNSGDIYLTGLLATELTKAEVLAALADRRTYAFQNSPDADRIYLTEYTADGHWMGESFDNDDNAVSFTVRAHASVPFLSAQLYKNGALIGSTFPGTNDFVWNFSDTQSFGEVYYFVKLVQEDEDALWSSPIWVKSLGQYQPPENQIMPISTLRENSPNGLPKHLGVIDVTIRGIATVGTEFGFNGPGYLQDSTGGIAVFGSLFTEKVIHDVPFEFEVTGSVSFYNGLTEIVPRVVTRLQRASFPAQKEVTTGELATNGEQFEGQLVVVRAATISGQFPPTGSDANIAINDGSGTVTLRIDKETNIAGSPTPSDGANVIGVVSQFDTQSPYNSGYQLMPRSLDDIEIATGMAAAAATEIPRNFALAQNYPNPFHGETAIHFENPRAATLRVEVLDMNGRTVRILAEGLRDAGRHRIVWDGRTGDGQRAGSGIYFLRYRMSESVLMKKMILLQ